MAVVTMAAMNTLARARQQQNAKTCHSNGCVYARMCVGVCVRRQKNSDIKFCLLPLHTSLIFHADNDNKNNRKLLAADFAVATELYK